MAMQRNSRSAQSAHSRFAVLKSTGSRHKPDELLSPRVATLLIFAVSLGVWAGIGFLVAHLL
jgi:hypothetical protein